MAQDHLKTPPEPQKGPWNDKKIRKNVKNLLELTKKVYAHPQQKCSSELLVHLVGVFVTLSGSRFPVFTRGLSQLPQYRVETQAYDLGPK